MIKEYADNTGYDRVLSNNQRRQAELPDGMEYL